MVSKELELPAKIEKLSELTDWIMSELQKINCPLAIQNKLSISLDEIFTNITSYAYSDREEPGTVKVEFELDKQESYLLKVVIKDKGIKFNPLEKKDPDVTLSAEERKIGGLGIFLVKKLMDEVYYSYENNENVLTIIKKISVED